MARLNRLASARQVNRRTRLYCWSTFLYKAFALLAQLCVLVLRLVFTKTNKELIMLQDPTALPVMDQMPTDLMGGQGIDQVPPEMAGAIVAGFLAFVCIALAVFFVINVIVCFLIYKPLSKLPKNLHPFNPGLVFLMLVPIANFVMPFMISTSFIDGFKNYFASVGDQSNGDCGKTIGLTWAIASVCSLIPYLNFISGPVALVCMIIFIVKLRSMANKINTAK